ncbi:hypothetical protein LIER_24533 [Lithospermum erythrorhizon]|uniref:Uncharacterized protein n=1 Tax=Lithospermum erythrorhizon TaxID=34254 RepID=A0AAV3R1D8_LITER
MESANVKVIDQESNVEDTDEEDGTTDVFINITQVESSKSGADKDLGGNEEAENVINEVLVSPSKGKSSELGKKVHENEIEEDIDIVGNSTRSWKVKNDDTRTRVNNKRIPKNVAPLSTVGIALNSKDEESKWKFIYNRRLAPKRVLSDVTKRNMLVREFICNLPRDVDDPKSNNYHKITLRNFVFNFFPDLINTIYGRTNEGDTGDSFILSDIVSTLTVGSITTWPPRS